MQKLPKLHHVFDKAERRLGRVETPLIYLAGFLFRHLGREPFADFRVLVSRNRAAFLRLSGLERRAGHNSQTADRRDAVAGRKRHYAAAANARHAGLEQWRGLDFPANDFGGRGLHVHRAPRG